MTEERPKHDDAGEDGPRVPDLHLDDLERRARQLPAEFARRAEDALARHVPALAPARLRSRVRRRTVALFALLGVMAVLAAGWAVLRETTLLRAAIESQLSERLGGDVSIDDVRWDGWNRVTATGLSLRARGWDGEAGTVARIARAEVVFAPLGILVGSIRLVDMEIDGLELSIVERASAPGEFNVLALDPAESSGGGSVGSPRSALLRDITVSFGIEDAGTVTPKATLGFAADFAHAPDDPRTYAFKLEQRTIDGAPCGVDAIRVHGTWDERTLSYDARLDPLRVGDTLLRMLPITAQRWAARAGLSGRMAGARLRGSAADPIRSGSVALEDISFRDRDAVRTIRWGRVEDGAVREVEGELGVTIAAAELSVEGSKVRLEARRGVVRSGAGGAGALEVPVEATFGCELAPVGGVPAALEAGDEWLARALRAVPFDLRLRIPRIDARPGADGIPRRVELPLDVAEAFGEVGITDWAANVDVEVIREAPGRPVATTARVDVVDGRIAVPGTAITYQGLQATLELRGDRVLISGLRASGGEGVEVRADAEVSLGGPQASFRADIDARRITVDHRTVARLPEGARRIVRQLLDDRAWNQLHDAGLVPAESRPSATLDARLAIAMDANGRTDVSGTIGIVSMWMVLEAFPYPLHVTGEVALGVDRVELPREGLQLRTTNGGLGTLRGHVEIPREGVRPVIASYLTFGMTDERLSRGLLACLPPSFESTKDRPECWPGGCYAPTAEVMIGLGLEASLRAQGTVRTRADGTDAVITRVEVSDGRVRPTEGLGAIMRDNGLAWPGRMPLDGVSGVIEASGELLAFRDGRAAQHHGTLRFDAEFPKAGPDGWLAIEIERFPLTRDLVQVADEGPSTEAALRAWDAFAPEGEFDGEVFWSRMGASTTTHVRARPRWIRTAGGTDVRVECGDLLYRDGELALVDVDLRVDDVDGRELRIEADGTVVGKEPRFRASVEGLSVEGPLVACGVRAADMPALTEAMASWRPVGRIDVALGMPGDRTQGPWEATIVPRWVVADHGGRELRALLHAGDAAFGPAGARLDGLEFAVDRGFVRVDGRFGSTDDSVLVGDVRVDACVAGMTDGLRALLPAVANDALDAIDFRTAAPVWTDGLRIAVDARRTGSERVAVDGLVGFADASFTGGLDFGSVDGTLAFDLAALGGRAAGTLGVDFLQLGFLGRRATDVVATIAFDPNEDAVRLADLGASLYGGRIAGRGSFDPGSEWSMHLACANVDFARFTASTAPVGPGEGGGDLHGCVDVRGHAERPGERMGHGRISVRDARMMTFPLGMSLLHVTQLTLPMNASMDAADIAFDVVDDRLRLHEFELSCGTLRLEGDGEVRIPGGELALRLRNRGTLPILSDLYGVVSDQFFAIDVAGTLSDPRPSIAPVPALLPRDAPRASAPAADEPRRPATPGTTPNP
jgi:hypothetical protein